MNDNHSMSIGLRLPRTALRYLRKHGIYAHAPVSLQHQHLAKRYVIRGMESGGATGDLGRYVTFAGEDGSAMEWLHPVEAIGPNGLHAVVVAPSLVRCDMLRKGQTYELLISRHRPGVADPGRRPSLETQVLFRGIHGRLELDLVRKEKAQAGTAIPVFYSLSGEEASVPKRFLPAVRALTVAVNCVGCSHSHYVKAPPPVDQSSDLSPDVFASSENTAAQAA